MPWCKGSVPLMLNYAAFQGTSSSDKATENTFASTSTKNSFLKCSCIELLDYT